MCLILSLAFHTVFHLTVYWQNFDLVLIILGERVGFRFVKWEGCFSKKSGAWVGFRPHSTQCLIFKSLSKWAYYNRSVVLHMKLFFLLLLSLFIIYWFINQFSKNNLFLLNWFMQQTALIESITQCFKWKGFFCLFCIFIYFFFKEKRVLHIGLN